MMTRHNWKTMVAFGCARQRCFARGRDQKAIRMCARVLGDKSGCPGRAARDVRFDDDAPIGAQRDVSGVSERIGVRVDLTASRSSSAAMLPERTA
jgi:hypothetical protein